VVSTRSEAVDPQLENNVARLTKPIEFAQVANRVDFVACAVEDIVYEPVRQMLFVACSPLTTTISNAVIGLDMSGGTNSRQAELPGRPGKLAVSGGGEYLYVSLEAGSQVTRLSLPSMVSNLQFTTVTSTDPYCDMVVLPGSGRSLAMSRYYWSGQPPPTGVVIYDDDLPRPNTIPGGHISFIEPGLSGSNLIAQSGTRFRLLNVDENGVYAQPFMGDAIETGRFDFSVGGNNLLNGSEVFNRSTFSKRGVLSPSFGWNASALSATGDRVVFIGEGNYSVNPIFFAGFRTDTLSLTGEARANGMPCCLRKLVLWGEDGVAAFSGDQRVGDRCLYLGRLDLAGPPSGDADRDGMPDLWESQHGLNPALNDATADLDHDGASNLLEYYSGTNPQSAEDVPRIEATVVGTDTLRLVFPCNGGSHFYVEKTSTLTNASWTSLYDAVSPGGLQMYCTSGITSGQGFFRVRITP
jgi:hypothetical protein